MESSKSVIDSILEFGTQYIIYQSNPTESELDELLDSKGCPDLDTVRSGDYDPDMYSRKQQRIINACENVAAHLDQPEARFQTDTYGSSILGYRRGL